MKSHCPQCHSRFVAGPFLQGLGAALVAAVFTPVFLIVFFPLGFLLILLGAVSLIIGAFGFLPSVKKRFGYACYACRYRWKPQLV